MSNVCHRDTTIEEQMRHFSQNDFCSLLIRWQTTVSASLLHMKLCELYPNDSALTFIEAVIEPNLSSSSIGFFQNVEELLACDIEARNQETAGKQLQLEAINTHKSVWKYPKVMAKYIISQNSEHRFKL